VKTPSFVAAIVRSRLAMWLIFLAYFSVFSAVDALSRLAGDVLLVAGTITLAIIFLKVRPTAGKGAFSTHCQQCDASLHGVGGLPRATCGECGHRQSWARSRD
jgi:hypothetical protein